MRVLVVMLLTTFAVTHANILFSQDTLKPDTEILAEIKNLLNKIEDDKSQSDLVKLLVDQIKLGRNIRSFMSEINKAERQAKDKIREKITCVKEKILEAIDWKNIGDCPIEFSNSVTSLIAEDKIVLWGGMKEKELLNIGAIYDISQDKWKKIGESQLEKRAFSSINVTSSKLIIWGGTNFNKVFSDGAIYNIQDDGWKAMKESPIEARQYHKSFIVENKLIIWGGIGTDYKKVFNDGAIYDIASDSWTKIKSSPLEVGFDQISLILKKDNKSTIATSKLIVWGGNAYHKSFNEVAVYDLKTNYWNKLQPFPIEKRLNPLVSLVGNKIVVFSGHDTEMKKSFTDGAIYNLDKSFWIKMKQSPISERDSYTPKHVTQLVGNKLLFWGGYNKSKDKYYNDGHIYDVAKDTWAKMSPSPFGESSNSQPFIIGDKFVLVKSNTEKKQLDAIAFYDLHTDKWVKLRGPSITETSESRIFITDNKLVICAGVNKTSTTSTSNPSSKDSNSSSTTTKIIRDYGWPYYGPYFGYFPGPLPGPNPYGPYPYWHHYWPYWGYGSIIYEESTSKSDSSSSKSSNGQVQQTIKDLKGAVYDLSFLWDDGTSVE